MDRGCLWPSQPSELHDGSSTRGSHVVGPDNEPKGGLRAIREAPPLGPKDERALSSGLGLRNENEKAGLESHLSGVGGSSRSCPYQVHSKYDRLWLWWHSLFGHGSGGEGQSVDESFAKLHTIWAHGC